MDYPNNFDIPDFPAGKTIAFSRSISIWISIVFFLIVVACGFTLLLRHFSTNYPFLISIDPLTYDWAVVAFPQKQKEQIDPYRLIQEKLASDVVQDWFTISGDNFINEARWQECSIEQCNEPKQFNPENVTCALSCKSDPKLFKEFSEKVLPQYRAMITQASERWKIKEKLIMPIIVSENNSKWRIQLTITSDVMGQFGVLIFMDIDRNIDLYHANFGYYVKQFNSYRITQ